MKKLKLTSYLIAKIECFPPKKKKRRQGNPLSLFVYNIVLEQSSKDKKSKKKVKKDKVKLSLFINNMITYVKNRMESTKRAIRINVFI